MLLFVRTARPDRIRGFDVFAKGTRPGREEPRRVIQELFDRSWVNPIGQFGSSEEDGGGDTSSSLKGSGWQFTFTPITEETSDIVERASVNFLCGR